jgi:hypothetical protein
MSQKMDGERRAAAGCLQMGGGVLRRVGPKHASKGCWAVTTVKINRAFREIANMRFVSKRCSIPAGQKYNRETSPDRIELSTS